MLTSEENSDKNKNKMIKIGLVNLFPDNPAFFFDVNIDVNHPASVIFMSMLQYMHALRFADTIPNMDMVKYHVK